ncbi:hypothetical protein ACS0ZG_09880 [Burkholderia gladioli]|uniref:hypothetical protein n=1 Tax=Burkholderia gladioli TaxID=28095 RepID=UPI00163E513D|nr:hypothetical protein [Burkholderia gladioli]MDA0569595.1 hypothetical protein [Burkholderia gladioli]MDA0597913.1 hypothetical protein [Burkholderia gladioli]
MIGVIPGGNGAGRRPRVARGVVSCHADGSADCALITFSLNLDLQRHPRRVELFHSRKAYPAITEQDSELIHARDIAAPAVDQLPAPVGSWPKKRRS